MKKPWYKKYWVWAIVLVLIVIVNIGTQDEVDNDNTTDTVEETGNEENAEEAVESSNVDTTAVESEVEEDEEVAEKEEPAQEEVDEKTPQEKMVGKIMELMDSGKAFDSGSYVKGDVPKGEYAFISFEGSGKYYSETDSAGNIIDNENFDSFGYVFVHDANNLETRGVLVSVDSFETLGVSGAKEIYELVNNIEDYGDSGMYKVGLDIKPNKYTIESYGEGYVAILAGPVGNSEIVDNEIFNGKYNVNVKEGQYLQVSKGVIVK